MNIEREIDELRRRGDKIGDTVLHWMEEIHKLRKEVEQSKGPEPLECWGVFNSVRQVTPQDEQDRKEMDLPGYIEEHMTEEQPADPEPLECLCTFSDEGALLGAWGPGEECPVKHRAIRMREVTQQDEQDRKDAARYRALKKGTTCSWDEILDKEIEGGDAK